MLTVIQLRRRAMRRRGSCAGFTLVELLLVLAILATLAAIVIPKFSGRTEQANVTAAKTQISNLGTALDSYEVDTGSYPDSNLGLQALLVQPGEISNWRGPYMKQDIPMDPWQHPYVYEFPGKHGEGHYDLYSFGPDGRAGTADDITNWTTTTK
ncbi:MAG: type II secretion system major pseudopilin GspG [Candidatus Hydrogenedentes bacterium]|nr:type II secretion system major pseudopilin GspG [Candidatus Hydrogenedentota bacterium]